MCTSIVQLAKDGSHILSRTMDWHHLSNQVVFVPRQYRWQSIFDNAWHTNRYAMVGGGGPHDNEIDVSDGVNEMGLSVQKLTFANGSQLVDDLNGSKTQLAPFEFPFWLLGNFASVAEIKAHIAEVQLMTDKFADRHFGKSELHFAALDKTGESIVIEPTSNPMTVRDNPLGVVTNSKDFDQQIERLGDYVDFTEDFKRGTVPLNTLHVTTGRFGGKTVPSSSYTPGGRFVRAAYYKERVDQPQDEKAAIVTAWHLLDSVSVPLSLKYRPTWTVYRAATCSESLTYYFQPYTRQSITSLQLTPEMLSWTEPRFYPVPNELFTENLND